MADKEAKGSAKRVRNGLEAHSLIGVVFGGLIYILCITGTLSVFTQELQRWEQPDAPEMKNIAPQAAAKAARTVFESEAEPTTHLFINFPQEALPRTVITTDTQAFFANEDGTVGMREHFPFAEFLQDLHFHLHLPDILGLTVVGAIGAMLLALSISGILAHPRIFRDAFTFRRGAGQLTTTDLHNRLSVWTLPFHFSNALTGAILGLVSILALLIAAVGFNNDTQALFDPIFGEEGPVDEAPAKIANIATPLTYMAENFPQLDINYFILHDPATAGQHSQVIASYSDRLIFGDYHHFTADGVYKGNTGLSDGTVGQQVTGAVYNVHFGNWGGLPIKLAYGLFGIALCVIVASGLSIYFSKRANKGRPAPRLAAIWAGLVWGTPALLATTLSAALLGFEGGSLVITFWTGLGFAMFIACLNTVASVRVFGPIALAGCVALSIALYISRYGGHAFSVASLGVTLCFAAIALIAAIWGWRLFLTSRQGGILPERT